MGRKPRVSPTETHARDRAVRGAIGRMLCAQYDLAEPLPERLRELLKQLKDADGGTSARFVLPGSQSGWS